MNVLARLVEATACLENNADAGVDEKFANDIVSRSYRILRAILQHGSDPAAGVTRIFTPKDTERMYVNMIKVRWQLLKSSKSNLCSESRHVCCVHCGTCMHKHLNLSGCCCRMGFHKRDMHRGERVLWSAFLGCWRSVRIHFRVQLPQTFWRLWGSAAPCLLTARSQGQR